MRFTRLVWMLAALGCGEERASRAPAPEPAPEIVTVDTATLAVPLSLPAQLYVEYDAAVYARSTGVVQSIHADLGTRVSAGQVLAQLERADQEIALAAARVAFENSTRFLKRQRALTAVRAGSVADSERVEAEHRQAALALRQAERNLALTRIVAPFAGVVTARYTRSRHLVQAGDSLFRITALAPVLAAVHVPEAATDGIRVGASVRVTDQHGRSAAAHVVRASPVIDPASGTREFVVEVESGSGLVPGASVSVQLGAEQRRVIAVPRSAIRREGYALVWTPDRTMLRPVTLGEQLDDGRVEVLGGLAPGERVVVAAR